MKKLLKKTLASLLLCSAVTGSAIASEGYYASQKAGNANAYPLVKLINKTYDNYEAQATFLPRGSRLTLTLGRYGSGMDVINYDIAHPDNTVCLDVIRHDDPYHHVMIFRGCLVRGDVVTIGPYTNNNKLPEVTVTKG